MKFDGKLSYLFNTGNNSGLIKNSIIPVYKEDCTILTRFTPDIDTMTKEMPDIGYLSCGIVCKNGMHIGIFFKQIVNHIGNDPWVFRFSFEYWEEGATEQTILDIDIDPNTIEGTTFDIELTKKGDTFIFSVDDETVEGSYRKLVDYSNAYLWVGAANRLAPDWKHELFGELHQMYIELEDTLPYTRRLFFDDYDRFRDRVVTRKDSKVVFLSNFKKVTYYKIFDDSDNGNHPIKYDEEWVQ